MKTLRLRDGLSWCRCTGRAVFLDREANRYLSLSPDYDAAFQRWAGGESSNSDASALVWLERRGLLVPDDGDQISPTRVALPPAARDLASVAGSASAVDMMRAALAQQRATTSLRRRGLADILRCAEQERGATRRHRADVEGIAQRIAAAMDAVGFILPIANRCLPRALAARGLGKRRGVDMTLVLGVRLDPFAAHSWAQLDDAVVVGDLEQVRLFTPILIVP